MYIVETTPSQQRTYRLYMTQNEAGVIANALAQYSTSGLPFILARELREAINARNV